METTGQPYKIVVTDPSSHKPDQYAGTGWQRKLFSRKCQPVPAVGRSPGRAPIRKRKRREGYKARGQWGGATASFGHYQRPVCVLINIHNIYQGGSNPVIPTIFKNPQLLLGVLFFRQRGELVSLF